MSGEDSAVAIADNWLREQLGEACRNLEAEVARANAAEAELALLRAQATAIAEAAGGGRRFGQRVVEMIGAYRELRAATKAHDVERTDRAIVEMERVFEAVEDGLAELASLDKAASAEPAGGWCFAPNADAEDWHGADSREDAIARGKLDYEGAPFVIAPGRRIDTRDFAGPSGRWLWDSMMDDNEIPEDGAERLLDEPTLEELDDLDAKVGDVIGTWLAPIAARCGYWMVDADKAEEVRP